MTRLLHRTIQDAAHRQPDAIATRGLGGDRSYQQLVRRSGALARTLLERGLQRQARVAVLLDRGPRVPESFYGVLAAGGALVPIDPRSPAAQIERILEATGATHLVTEPKRAAGLGEIAARCHTLRHVIGVVDPIGDRSIASWTEVEAAETNDGLPDVPVLELDTAYILHTSGSTGTPKLIRHTHASAMAFVEWAVAAYDLGSEDRLSQHSSHHTCFATFDYYAAARAGASTVLFSPATLKLPGSLSLTIEREAISVWYSVPTALVQLLLRGALEERDLASLRWILFAGETFPRKHLERLRRRLPKARFSHVYGSTEVNVCTYYHLPDGEFPDPLPIGRPCEHTAAEVVDGDLEPVAAGASGELLIRGSTVMSGYWNDPDRNHTAFYRRPSGGGFEETYFRTGDQVQTLANGDLAFVARTDLQIKIRGHRVELGEVEAALLDLDEVEEAVAYSVSDGEASLSLRAAVVSRGATSADALRDRLRDLLPAYAVPESLEILDRLPRTPTGKVDRQSLSASGQIETREQKVAEP